MENEVETIDGFDIPKRELTPEEANREVTLDRFHAWHAEVGEDFTDQFSSIDHKIYGGYLMAKYPNKSAEILAECNNKYGECQGYKTFMKKQTQDGIMSSILIWLNL